MPKNRLVRALDSRRTARAAVTNVPSGGGTTVTLDHGTLTGLADDDHTQYYNTARGDARYALRSRTVTGTGGLTGGGALTANLTLSLASGVAGNGLTLTNGVLAVGAGNGISVAADSVALASTSAGGGLTYTNGVLAVGAGLGITVNADDVALASSVAGAGLSYSSGVLAVGAGLGITVNANDVALASSVAGNGLTYTSGVLAVGAGAGLTVSSTTVALTTPGTLTVSSGNTATGSHTHAITSSDNVNSSTTSLLKATNGELTLHRLTSALVTGTTSVNTNLLSTRSSSDLTITTSAASFDVHVAPQRNAVIDPGGDVILDPAGNDVYPQSNYDLNLGLINKKFLTLHAAELWVETLVAQNTIATIGGRILVGPTTTLIQDLGSGVGDTTIYVKHNEMVSGDRVYMEADGKFEFMAITGNAVALSPGPGYSYTVTRNLDGSGATAWYAGDAIFNTGTTNDGFIDLYSIQSIKRREDPTNTEVGPTIVGNVRTGTAFNAWAPRWAVGNLNGLYGYSATTYGFAAGNPSTTWLSADATNGIRVNNGSYARFQVNASGDVVLRDAAGTTRVALDSSSGDMGFLGDSGQQISILPSTGRVTLRGTTGLDTIRLDSDGSLTMRDASNRERVVLTSDGNLYLKDTNNGNALALTSAGNAEFTGKVTAASGAIGGWNIGATALTAGSSTTRVGLATTGDAAFYAGSETPGSAPFRVTNAGALTAQGATLTSATVSGAITATSGSFTGTASVTGSGRIESLNDSSQTVAYLDKNGITILEGNTQMAAGNSLLFRGSVGGAATAGISKWAQGTAAHFEIQHGTSSVDLFQGALGAWVRIDPELVVGGQTTIYGDTTISRGTSTSGARTLTLNGAVTGTGFPFLISFTNYESFTETEIARIQSVRLGSANEGGLRFYTRNGSGAITSNEALRLDDERVVSFFNILSGPTINATTQYTRDGVKGGILTLLGADAFDLRDTGNSQWQGTLARDVGTYTFDVNDTNNGTTIPTEAYAVVILLSGNWGTNVAAANYAIVRPYGAGDGDGTMQMRSMVNNISIDMQGVVPLDANGRFEIRINGDQMKNSLCRVVGYYI